MRGGPFVRWFADITLDDVPLVGGKNASLGELYRELSGVGVRVPNGFAVTADAYGAVIEAAALSPRIAHALRGIDGRDVGALAAAGATIRSLIQSATWPPELVRAVREAYAALEAESSPNVAVAVRSRRRRTSRRRASRASTRRFSACAGRLTCWRHAAGASPLSSPIAPWPIASSVDSITSPSGCRSGSSAWCGRISGRRA